MKDKQTPAYYSLIPEELHPDLEQLLDYLEFRPFEEPKRCVKCGGARFFGIGSTSKLQVYECSRCKKRFNRLTDTVFTKMRYLDLWGEFARLRFSGVPLVDIAKKLGMPYGVANTRDRRINALMREDYPQLYAWWSTHQNHQNRTMTPVVAQQKQAFKDWLQNIFEQKKPACPYCGKSSHISKSNSRKPHPTFKCSFCQRAFSLLAPTHLAGLLYPHLWPRFTDLLIEGQSDEYIAATLGVSYKAPAKWRKRFLLQMQAMGLTELIQWQQWQRVRNRNHWTKDKSYISYKKQQRYMKSRQSKN